MQLIRHTIQSFNKVSLADLDKVKLMNRTDQKFCIHLSQMPAVLKALETEYSILEIDGESIFNYDNIYFDTPDNLLYLHHHNGKLNRFKIRIRSYVQSDLNFLEIKLKNNKGRTIKKRMIRKDFDSEFTTDELNFIGSTTPFSGELLVPKIKSYFQRITLVNLGFTERVTLDFKPGFLNGQNQITMNNLVIIEVKQDKASDIAAIIKILRKHKIINQGISKYCIGRSLIDENIKKNNFKPILLKIRKEYFN
jgi:hypothetical protein